MLPEMTLCGTVACCICKRLFSSAPVFPWVPRRINQGEGVHIRAQKSLVFFFFLKDMLYTYL